MYLKEGLLTKGLSLGKYLLFDCPFSGKRINNNERCLNEMYMSLDIYFLRHAITDYNIFVNC
uniref:Uncharacterized protein n=1 Tax=Anguilla anguilla TaxID=7936 RepID=A0A0E9WSQ2_ANGAN